MTRPMEMCWWAMCCSRGSGGTNWMRLYRFGGTASTTFLACTVTWSETTVTVPGAPLSGTPLRTSAGTLLASSAVVGSTPDQVSWRAGDDRTMSPPSSRMRSARVRDTDCIPPTTRLSRMKSSSTRLEKEPAEAAIRTACSVENA
jgi:hypothetical protein